MRTSDFTNSESLLPLSYRRNLILFQLFVIKVEIENCISVGGAVGNESL
jgi:hypothetical protein